ncbi:MAG: toll/interleukin-1 receptor domain-containing protein [Acidobacteria bacterium]|nr:toll/interleukin-1 receptor domain-containing protein [Acidobacteriota bacterium]
MFDVFVCHSPAEREIAERIAARLERGAEARARLEECDSIPNAWEGGSDCGAILLLLSADAVPARPSREAWESVLRHVERNALPPLGTILVRVCAYPKLLEQRPFFRWSDNPAETLRTIERWILSLQPADEPPTFEPARLPWFRGRQTELQQLWRHLVDGSGTVVLSNPAPASGKTCLAQEFARSAAEHFRDVCWIDCAGRPAASVLGEMASCLRGFGSRRLLLVLDGVTGELPVTASPDDRSSLLITSHSRDLQLPEHAVVLEIESAPGSGPGQAPADPAELRLWRSMSVCRPNSVPLELAACIAEIEVREARTACARLVERRLADPLDAAGARFRMRPPLPDNDLDVFRRRHAEELIGSFAARCSQWISEFDLAYPRTLREDWGLATRLARHAFTMLREHGRFREAAPVYERLRAAALQRQDAEVVKECSWELSWLQDETGEIRRPPTQGDQLALDFS